MSTKELKMKSKQSDKKIIGFTKNYLTQVEKYQNYLSDNKSLYVSFNEINKLLKIAIETIERKSNRA